MRFFLHLKPWALFALCFALPCLVQLLSNLALFSQSPQLRLFLLGFIVSMLFFTGGLFSWLWALGTQLPGLLPGSVTLPTRWLKLGLAVPSVYILGILLVLSGIFRGASFNPALAALLIPLHLLSMAGIFYSLYFVAKALKTVELQHSVGFGDFIGEFFLLWFFPIGIWILQPRVNRLFASARQDAPPA